MNSNKFFFLLILFFSTLISISSNSWMGCWIGLEINLLSFIPIISNVKNLFSSEAALKYFLIQSIASVNFLFLIMLNMIFMKLHSYELFLTILINSSLFMKMGAAPFHFWFPNIMEGLSWMNCFILMTWQKITPMILLSYYFNFNFLIMIAAFSTIMGSIGGLNQTSLRKILAFSSINHLSWMIMAILISKKVWNFYFIIYTLMMIIMCFMLFMFNCLYLNQLFFINLNSLTKMFFFFNLLSLGGLPPFLGFFPKWLMINFMINNNLYLISMIMIMMALVTLFYYIRITYSTFMFNYLKLKWFKLNMNNNLLNMINILSFSSLTGLMLSTFYFFLF